MPDFVGGIKFPVPGDAYNSAYGEPQWWKDLAETAAAQIATKADAGHSHSWAQITGKPSSFPSAWADVAGKPSTFPPSAHKHPWSDITDRPAAYPPAAHTHSGLSNGTFSVDLSSAGAFALRSGSSNMVQWNASNGNLVAGNVPWARVTDKPSMAEVRRHATGTFNANDAAEGVDLIRTTVTHSNLPRTGGSWALKTEKQAGDVVWQEAVSWGLVPEVWRRIYGSYWAAWVRVDAGAVEVPEVVLPVAAPSQSVTGFKTVPVALTVGGGVHNYPATQGGVRIPVNFGATIKRWRLHIRNINPRQGEPGAGNVTISSVYIGRHGGNGTVSGGNTLVGGAMSSSSGSDMVTPWTDAVIDSRYEYLISYGWTAAQQPKQVVGGGYTTATVDGAFNNATTATRSVNLPLDVWIEAEVEADVPVIAGFGDSLTSGVGAVLPVFNSWLSAYCRTQKAIPVHYSASGDTMAGWSDPEHYKWTRWEGLTRPDAVVHAMGSNDVFGGATLAQMQDRFNTTAAILAEKVTPVIHAATILPRNGSSWDAMEPVRRDYNTWVKARVRAQHGVAAAISTDDDNIRSEYNADGIHLNAAGYSAMAAAITSPLVSSTVTDRIAALERDTGFRSITHSGASGSIHVARVGETVTVRLVDFVPPPGTHATHVAVLPSGFGWAAKGGFLAFNESALEPPSFYAMYSGRFISWHRTIPNSNVHPTVPMNAEHKFTTADPWPTTLPGSPA